MESDHSGGRRDGRKEGESGVGYGGREMKCVGKGGGREGEGRGVGKVEKR